MLQDIIKISPRIQKNYYAGRYEFATPVVHPRAKAWHFFQWALIFHARKKPAEAYKYYEKALIHHKRPLYLRQMALLHHEMGYFRDATSYLRSALEIEKKEYRKRKQEAEEKERQATTTTGSPRQSKKPVYTRSLHFHYHQDHSIDNPAFSGIRK
ncbi:MAG TPA: tetratricopeptide repeat protein [Bacteroidales bacterium]|nr:tetratricopeptide repeat protein [Bacteroidales bacterium]